MNEVQSSFLYWTPVINSLLTQGTWCTTETSHLFRVLWHCHGGSEEDKVFQGSGIDGVLQKRISVWKLMIIAQPTPWLEQHPSKGKFYPKRNCRVAPPPLCISQSWWDISLKLRPAAQWPLRGNTNILRWLPGRVGNISPSSSILLHVKVFGDPQKFSSELVSLWAVLIQWTQNLQDSQSMIFELVRKVFRNIAHLHTNISFWVSVCISATFWLTALHY